MTLQNVFWYWFGFESHLALRNRWNSVNETAAMAATAASMWINYGRLYHANVILSSARWTSCFVACRFSCSQLNHYDWFFFVSAFLPFGITSVCCAFISSAIQSPKKKHSSISRHRRSFTVAVRFRVISPSIIILLCINDQKLKFLNHQQPNIILEFIAIW